MIKGFGLSGYPLSVNKSYVFLSIKYFLSRQKSDRLDYSS